MAAAPAEASMATKLSSERGSTNHSAASSRQSSTERSTSSAKSGSLPSAVTDKSPEDPGKLRTFLGILRRFIGVSDMAAVRFSLPAQLLEPVPNLEYWHYLDRPEAFASIGDSDDALGRMLGTLRFWFTKDLKYVKGKPCKPYNSVLGEFFRCYWEVDETMRPLVGSEPASLKESQEPFKVLYLTEQTSHHPPVSAFHITCPEKGITARGFDQLSANFTGTRIRVAPGNYNQGIFITLQKRDNETYNLTHPVAHLGGFLKGSLSISVSESCFVRCAKTKLKAIITYQEEAWLGKTQNRLVGVVYKYDPDNDTFSKIKDVPLNDIVARIEGSWHEKIYFTEGNKPFDQVEKKILIVDLTPLLPQPKQVPPDDAQLPNESQKFWATVTDNILNKQYSAATSAKVELEERQRQKAAERKARNVAWQPRFFKEALGPAGQPELSDEGAAALQKLARDDFYLAPSLETAA